MISLNSAEVQLHKTIAELQRIRSDLLDVLEKAIKRGDELLAHDPGGNRYAAESGVLTATVEIAAEKIGNLIDEIKGKKKSHRRHGGRVSSYYL